MEVPPSSIFFDGFSMKFTIQLLGYHHLWKRLRGLKMWPPHVGRVRSAQWVVRKNLPNPQSLQKPKWQVTSPFMDFNDIFMVLFSMFWLGLEKKVQQPDSCRKPASTVKKPKRRWLPSADEILQSSRLDQRLKPWQRIGCDGLNAPVPPKNVCSLSVYIHTYIQTDRQTDGQTDIHTYIHMILVCVCCVCCVCCVSMQLSMSSNADSPRQMTCVKPCARVQQVTLGVFTSLAGEFYSNGYKDSI